MIKILVLTINDYNNYGNRLQNYAVQEVLVSFGIDVITMVNNPILSNTRKEDSKIKRIFNFLYNNDLVTIRQRINYKLNKSKIVRAKIEKDKNLRGFSKNYINETECSITSIKIPSDLEASYDYFITGSDQVWNPTFKRFSNLDFLTFAPKEKRIAYAASFGIDSIPLEFEARFKEWIEGMNHLSVREEAGARIIRELTGREAVVLIDPTMMLDKNDWLRISKESIYKPSKKFICTYFLGGTYELHKKEITKISVDNEMELVNLGSIYDLKRYSDGPSEFLDYIASCELFLTDSFHGAIFSILFKKPFVVFDRIGNMPSMSSRVETLLSKFKLESRKWERVMKTRDYFEVDFSHVHSILEAERNKAYGYLNHALNIKDQPLQ